MGSFIERLTSRKFILTVAAVATFITNKQYTEAAGCVVAFLAAEGIIDTVAVRKQAKAVEDEVEAVLDSAEDQA